jgi:group I intron endonuclease
MGYIYKITNQLNSKCYIGYSEDPERRWLAHQHNRGSKVVWQSIQKNSLSNFTFEIIAEDTVDNENNYIIEHNSLVPNGYNLTVGGGLPPNHKGKRYEDIYGIDRADEQRQKRTATQLERGGYGPKVHTATTRKKISKALAGENNPIYGTTRSNETRARIGAANKGKLAGKNNPKARVIVLISPEGIVHNCHGTLKKKCNELGLSFATIRAALEHNRIPNSGTAKGWTVKYDI